MKVMKNPIRKRHLDTKHLLLIFTKLQIIFSEDFHG